MTDSKTFLPLRFSLRTLIGTAFLIACCCGAYSLGRQQGRRDAEPEIDQLNAECADLMNDAFLHSGSTIAFTAAGPAPPSRVYDFTKPEDRAEYRKQNAKRWRP